MSAKPTADKAEAPPKSKKMLIIIVAVLALVLAGGGGAFFFLKKKHADEEDSGDGHSAAETKSSKKSGAPPEFMAIDNMVVNLADPGGNRFAQVGITLQVDAATTSETIKKYMPAVRHGILSLVARRTSDELLTPEGKDQLAKDILELVRETTDLAGDKKHTPIEAVLFSSFIVQ